MLILALLAACTGRGDTDATDDTDGSDTDEPVVDGCRAGRRPADAARAVVISRPYTADGDRAYVWEALSLAPDGALSRGPTFEMGRAPFGEVVFTRDGSLGLVAQDDGTLGVFTVDAEGAPAVVEAGWNDGDAFYADSVTVDPSGERAWVVDGNWPNNGGGLYEIALDCETGAPSLVGLVVESKLASRLFLLDDGRALVVATEVDGAGDADAFLLDGLDAPAIVGSARLFGYEDAIVGGAAVTADGRYLLVGDYSEFSGEDNRVAIAAIDPSGLSPVDEVVVLDPIALAASPFDDAVLVASGYGNRLWRLGYAPDAEPPFHGFAEVDASPNPALPSTIVVVRRGELAGTALVSENTAVRRVRFTGEGTVDDLGPFELGDGLDQIPGALGVQP